MKRMVFAAVAAMFVSTLSAMPSAEPQDRLPTELCAKRHAGKAVSRLDAHKGILCLTFDDGFFDSWRKMLPLFEKHHAHATFFVNGEIGEKQLEAMKEFKAKGHSIGLHGQRHQKAAARMEKLGEKAYLEQEVLPQLAPLERAGLSVKNWAYPWSDRSPATDAALGRYFTRLRTGHIFKRDPQKMPLAGCDAAFASREGLETRRVLPGLGIGSRFPGIAEDLEKGLERLAARDELLVIYTHNVNAVSDGSANNTTLDVIERVLEKADSLGIAVVGFDELP